MISVWREIADRKEKYELKELLLRLRRLAKLDGLHKVWKSAPSWSRSLLEECECRRRVAASFTTRGRKVQVDGRWFVEERSTAQVKRGGSRLIMSAESPEPSAELRESFSKVCC